MSAAFASSVDALLNSLRSYNQTSDLVQSGSIDGRYSIGPLSIFLTSDQRRVIPVILVLIVFAILSYVILTAIDKRITARTARRKASTQPKPAPAPAVAAAPSTTRESVQTAPAPVPAVTATPSTTHESVQTAPAPAPAPTVDASTPPEEELPEIRVPQRLNGAPLAYHYDDVAVTAYDENVYCAEWLDVRAPIALQPAPDRGSRAVLLLMSGHPFAYLEGTKLADMAIDWVNRDDPYFVALRYLSSADQKISVFLGFYRKRVAANSKEYKLVSNKNSDMQAYIACCSEGDECSLCFDFEKDKYLVTSDGFEIGYLPKSAGTLVEDVGEDEVSVFISAIDLDDEGRSVVTVSVEY